MFRTAFIGQRGMITIDILLLCGLGVGAVRGFMKGFLRQLATVLGLVAGLLAARALYASLAEFLCPTVTESMTVAQILAFLLIWIAVPLAFALVARLLTKAMEAVSLGWLNRLLGAALGLLKALLLTSLLISALEYIDTKNALLGATKKQESLLYYPVAGFVGILFPVAEELTQKYIDLEHDGTRRTQ